MAKLTKNYLQKKWSLTTKSPIEFEDQAPIPFDCLALNYYMGGGLYPGRMLELFGWESSGKSLLAYNASKNCLKLGGIVLYVDAERALIPSFTLKNGFDLKNERSIVYESAVIEQISDFLMEYVIYLRSQVLTNAEPILIVVDSMSQLIPQDFMGENSGHETRSAEMGKRARQIGLFIRERNETFSDLGISWILINQIRKKMSANRWEDPDTTPGGNALRFAANYRILVKPKKKILGADKKRVGNVTTITWQKNKVTGLTDPFDTEIYISGEKTGYLGINRYMGWVDCLLKEGVLKRKNGGNSILFKGKSIGLGIASVTKNIAENPSLRKKLIKSSSTMTLSKVRKKLEKLSGKNHYLPILQDKYKAYLK